MTATRQKQSARAAVGSRSRRTSSKSTARNGGSAGKSAASSKATTSHEVIRRWAEKRGGHPATVKRTTRGGEAGVLRIDFPGYRGKDSLEEISWDDFFEKFDEKNLSFLYQDKTASGKPSRFFKLVSRDTAKGKSKR